MNLIDVPTIDPRDDFQCTYFRQRTNRKSEKKNLFSWSGDNPLTSDLSDNCSDSDNESDNTTNVIRWLESLPIDEEMYDVEDNSNLSGTSVSVNDKSSDIDISIDPSQKKKSKLVFTHGKVRASTKDTLKTDPKELSINSIEDISITKMYTKTIDRRKILKNKNILTSRNETILLKSDSLNKNDENVKEEANKTSTGKLESRMKENSIETHVVKETRFLVEDQRSSIDESSMNSSLTVQNYDEPNKMLETMNELSTIRIERNEEPARKAIEKKAKISTAQEKSTKYILQERSSVSTKSSAIQQKPKFDSIHKKLTRPSRNVQIINNRKAKQGSEIAEKSTVESTRDQTFKNTRILPECQHRKRSVQKFRFPFTNQSIVDEDPTRFLRIDGTKLCGSNKSKYTGKIQEQVSLEVRRKKMKKQCPNAQKKMTKLKMIKNKCLLRKVEDIVDRIETSTDRFGQKTIRATSELLEKEDRAMKIEPYNGDTAQRKIVKVVAMPEGTRRSTIAEEQKKKCKRLSTPMENQTIDTRASKRPIFRNPEVERNLDNAMERALNKYKRSHKTWESLIEKNSSTSHEPPVKKQKSRSSCPRSLEATRWTFPALDSSQSIYKYFCRARYVNEDFTF